MKTKIGSKIILFTCNWNAYSGLEAAGVGKFSYSPSVFPIRLSCLGRITPGIIMKAFEKGADGVILVGCSEDECHYQTGGQQVKEVFQESQRLLKLLGYSGNQLRLEYLDTGNGELFVEKVQNFVKGIENLQKKNE
ncbi:MAG: hydrogenase iron-sulfur subunit [Anaerolineales bacterium]